MPFFMWLFPLLFFAYQFILRLWPGLMMEDIMEQFSIDATHFGVLAAFYYYGYAGMQMPIAILLERFGTRYVVFAFASTCGLATLAFTYTDNFYVAILSRFLVGAGSAVGFLGVSKVLSEWFPKEQYARLVGLSFSFGLMGAVFGGKPINLLIDTYSWQTVATVLAGVSILIGCCAYIVLRPKACNKNAGDKEPFKLMNFKQVLSSRTIWLLAFANFLMVGSLEGLSDVWGVPYLMTAYNLNKGDAAGLISFIFLGMLVGGPLLVVFSRAFGEYLVIATCGLSMAFAFMVLLLHQEYNAILLPCLFFAIGIMCCYQVMMFAAGSNLVARQNLGVTIAFLNCMNMLGGSFFHTVIGRIMDMSWSGEMSADGLRVYDLEAYQYALSVVPISAILGSAIVCFIALRLRYKQPELSFK